MENKKGINKENQDRKGTAKEIGSIGSFITADISKDELWKGQDYPLLIEPAYQ